MKRADGRMWNELRKVRMTPGYQSFAEGSVLIEMGKTQVLCAVSVEERVPDFVRATGGGWITAEYSMLPRATFTRTQRDSSKGQVNGRSQEIQRLIGRSLRSISNLNALGSRTFTIDCDVIQADGGTRTAAITGSYVALYMAMQRLVSMGLLKAIPLKSAVAATSVGIVHNNKLLDLCYDEDSTAGVDFNVVMTSKGEFVELQGTAEGKPFDKQAVDDMLEMAEKGIKELFAIQQETINTFTKR